LKSVGSLKVMHMPAYGTLITSVIFTFLQVQNSDNFGFDSCAVLMIVFGFPYSTTKN